MSADIIQFIPRSNPKADRAFWKGPDLAQFTDEPLLDFVKRNALATMATEIMDQIDTAPSEYVAPETDPA